MKTCSRCCLTLLISFFLKKLISKSKSLELDSKLHFFSHLWLWRKVEPSCVRKQLLAINYKEREEHFRGEMVHIIGEARIQKVRADGG